ncbi:hypothetical protein TNCV_5014121 [Trichonephila clavipes]|nr:hypothetical protein TNCV_5014121 [Trichonephila clavipes]
MNVLNVMSEWDYTNERVLFWMDLNGDFEWIRDGEPLARVPLMAHGTIFWARHRLKRSTAIDSSIKEFSVGFSQFKELSETLKFIMYPDVTSFDKLNLP